jgi:uncharacterized protein (DUF2062 family)
MPRKYLKKISPNREKLKKYKILKIFGKFIHDPNLWHFNRYSTPKAFAVGLFLAWVPVPFQMTLAALGAIIFRANLPLSIALVWTTNPITMPPLFLFAYVVGAKILSLPIRPFKFQLSLDWLTSLIGDIWQPFLLGCLICGIISAFLGNILIKMIWRYVTIKSWKERARKRKKIKKHS